MQSWLNEGTFNYEKKQNNNPLVDPVVVPWPCYTQADYTFPFMSECWNSWIELAPQFHKIIMKYFHLLSIQQPVLKPLVWMKLICSSFSALLLFLTLSQLTSSWKASSFWLENTAPHQIPIPDYTTYQWYIYIYPIPTFLEHTMQSLQKKKKKITYINSLQSTLKQKKKWKGSREMDRQCVTKAISWVILSHLSTKSYGPLVQLGQWSSAFPMPANAAFGG